MSNQQQAPATFDILPVGAAILNMKAKPLDKDALDELLPVQSAASVYACQEVEKTGRGTTESVPTVNGFHVVYSSTKGGTGHYYNALLFDKNVWKVEKELEWKYSITSEFMVGQDTEPEVTLSGGAAFQENESDGTEEGEEEEPPAVKATNKKGAPKKTEVKGKTITYYPAAAICTLVPGMSSGMSGKKFLFVSSHSRGGITGSANVGSFNKEKLDNITGRGAQEQGWDFMVHFDDGNYYQEGTWMNTYTSNASHNNGNSTTGGTATAGGSTTTGIQPSERVTHQTSREFGVLIVERLEKCFVRVKVISRSANFIFSPNASCNGPCKLCTPCTPPCPGGAPETCLRHCTSTCKKHSTCKKNFEKEKKRNPEENPKKKCTSPEEETPCKHPCKVTCTTRTHCKATCTRHCNHPHQQGAVRPGGCDGHCKESDHVAAFVKLDLLTPHIPHVTDRTLYFCESCENDAENRYDCRHRDCDTKVCEDCFKKCALCKKLFCEEHVDDCINCESTKCYRCTNSCFKCSVVVCDGNCTFDVEMDHCEDCNRIFCTKTCASRDGMTYLCHDCADERRQQEEEAEVDAEEEEEDEEEEHS